MTESRHSFSPKGPKGFQRSRQETAKQHTAAQNAYHQKGPQLPCCLPKQEQKAPYHAACCPEQIQSAGQRGNVLAQGAQQIVQQNQGAAQQHGLEKRGQGTHPNRRPQKPPWSAGASS